MQMNMNVSVRVQVKVRVRARVFKKCRTGRFPLIEMSEGEGRKNAARRSPQFMAT